MFNSRQFFQRWAARRSPPAEKVVLAHRTIYVFPSKQGAFFLLVVLLIWVLGTNYQNNIILGLSFFLTSLLLLSIIHAFKNLLGLTFSAAAVQSTILGEMASFNLVVGSRFESDHHNLIFVVGDSAPVSAEVKKGQEVSVCLQLEANHRGWMKLPRFTLKTYYPFGLVRGWAYIKLDHRALVFPRPIACDKPPLGMADADEGLLISSQHGDEFNGFDTYQPGSPPSQIAWKHYARGLGLHLKDYRALQSQHYWLDWNGLPTQDTELSLSQLSYWVNQFSEQQIQFGLLLPQQTIPLGTGDVHRLQALTALALYGWEKDEPRRVDL